MEDDRPRVTITDPSAPAAASGDLLAGGGEPWRPTRRQVLAAAVVLALLGSVTAAVLVRRHERALDAAAVRDVAVAVTLPQPALTGDPGNPTDPGYPEPPESTALRADVPLQVVNLGTRPVRVLSVRLLPDADALDAGAALLPRLGAVDVTVQDTTSCPDAPRTQRATVEVVLLTERGDQVRRVVGLGLASDTFLDDAQSVRCGLLVPAQAVEVRVRDARTRAGMLALTVLLTNRSRTAVELERFTAPPGLSLTAPASVTLPVPPGTDGRRVGSAAPRAVTMALRVSDCADLVGTLTSFEPTAHVGVRATNAFGEGEVQIWLMEQQVAPALQQLVKRSCRDVPAGVFLPQY